MNKKLLKIFGIILGVLAIVLAIVIFTQDVGYYESNHSYGGDAYTGIQNASAQAANNIMYVGELIRFSIGSLMLVMGLGMLLGSLCITTGKKAAAPMMQAPIAPIAPMTPKAPAAPNAAQPAPAPKAPAAQPPVTAHTPVFGAPDGYQASVVYPVSNWKCANCGSSNEPDSRFCQNCGTAKQ